jgi:hypothetical protein
MEQGEVGRLLVASLHQSIADELPTRLEFYENWLRAEALRDGAIGLSALAAVLSFLRQEGAPYDRVTNRAGEYAADWSFSTLSGTRLAVLRLLPHSWRGRMALSVARRLVHQTFRKSFALSRLRRGEGTFDIRHSVFCSVREPATHPLCGYYAAAVTRLFALCAVNGTAISTECRGVGGTVCRVAVALDRSPRG